MSAQVIIIGSGMAGLGAAKELIENGITDIIVLEAQNRVGGRTHTVPFGGHNIEIGAQWIHGKENNPIYDLAEPLGLVDEETKTMRGGQMYYATQDAKPVEEDYVDKVNTKIDDLYDTASSEIDGLESDKSLGQIMDTNFENLVGELTSEMGLDDGQVETLRAMYDAKMKEERITSACEALSNLSALGWNSFENSSGDDMINLKYGYGKVIEHLVSIVSMDRIKLNDPVTKIEYDDQVRITTKNNEYMAQYCICTFPLGYLKENHESLFSPSLPDNKAQAIQSLGFGVVNKFFLIFEAPVLKGNEQGFQILWRNDLSFTLDAAKKWKLGTHEFYKTFSTFEISPVMDNVMYTFLYGQDGIYSENLKDECIIDVIRELLEKCFPIVKLPKIKQLVRSKWASQEFTKGSYTHIPMGASVADIEALAEPLDSKVFFAGESTSAEFVSTVHGAFQSGIREARNIIEAIHGN